MLPDWDQETALTVYRRLAVALEADQARSYLLNSRRYRHTSHHLHTTVVTEIELVLWGAGTLFFNVELYHNVAKDAVHAGVVHKRIVGSGLMVGREMLLTGSDPPSGYIPKYGDHGIYLGDHRMLPQSLDGWVEALIAASRAAMAYTERSGDG